MFYLKLKYEVDKMSIMENEVDGVVVGEGGGGSETLARGYSIFSGRRNIVEEGKVLVRGICQTFGLIGKSP